MYLRSSNEAATVPFKKLCDNRTLNRFQRWDKCSGIVLVNWFCPMSKKERLLQFPNSLGKGSLSRFRFRLSSSRLLTFLMSVEMLELIILHSRWRGSSSSKFPISEGRDPEIALLGSDSLVNALSWKSSEGNDPGIRLLCRVSFVNAVNFPASKGIEPSIRVLSRRFSNCRFWISVGRDPEIRLPKSLISVANVSFPMSLDIVPTNELFPTSITVGNVKL